MKAQLREAEVKESSIVAALWSERENWIRKLDQDMQEIMERSE